MPEGVAVIARILDSAGVRIEADTRRGERDAARAGETYGRRFAQGADQELRRRPARAPVDPVSTDFERKLRAMVAQIASKVNAGIPLTARGEQFRRDVAQQLLAVERTLRAKIPADPVLAADFRRNLLRQVEDEARRVRARVSLGVDIDRNRITRSLSGLVGMFSRAGEKVSGIASTAFAPVNKILGSLDLSLSGIAIALGVAAAAAPALAAGLSVIGGSAIAAFGAISAGAIGLPVVLSSLIAPIAAIALGMDGIKRAAAPLADEFQSLKDSVSIAFELGLRPVFEKLQALFPTLNVGLAEVARGVVRVASDFAGILTTPAGIENIRVALAGVSDVIDRMRPGLSVLFSALLNVAGTRELYDILGDTIGGVAERFGNMIERVRSSGDLTGALESLRDVLFSVTDLLAALAEGSITFFRQAGPGLTAFFESLTETIGRIDFGTLGESFGALMERIGNAIQRVPPETWQKLADAVGSLTERFLQWTEQGGIEDLIRGLTLIGNVLSWFAGNWLLVYSAASGFMDFISGVPGKVASVAGSIGSSFGSIPADFSASLGGLPASAAETFTQVNETAASGLEGFLATAGEWFSGLGSTLSEGWQQVQESTTSSLEGFGTTLDGFFSNLPDRIGYWMGFLVTSLVLYAQDGLNGVTEWFGQLPGKIELFVSDMVLRIQNFFTALPGQLVGWSVAAIFAVVGVFQELPGRIAAFVEDMVVKIGNFFIALPGQLWNWSGQAVDSVINAFREMPGKVAEWAGKTVDDILQFFKDLPGKLWQAAQDAVQGFIDGLKAKAQSVVDTAKEVVRGALRGARDAIAAHSPSLRFRDLGHDTIDGYLVGLRERLAPMLAAVRAVFAQAIAAATQAGSGNIDLGASGFSLGQAATGRAVGSALPAGVDLPTLMEGLARVLNAAELRAERDGITLMVDDGHRVLARR